MTTPVRHALNELLLANVRHAATVFPLDAVLKPTGLALLFPNSEAVQGIVDGRMRAPNEDGDLPSREPFFSVFLNEEGFVRKQWGR